MNVEQALLEQVRALTPAQQQEVLDFATFLWQKAPVSPKQRVLGLHKGIPCWIADDFDAPLPGSFWLGKE
jgi:hypothetical protein